MQDAHRKQLLELGEDFWAEYVVKQQDLMKAKKKKFKYGPPLPEWIEVPELEPTSFNQILLNGELVEKKIIKIRYKKVIRNYGVPLFKKNSNLLVTPKKK